MKRTTKVIIALGAIVIALILTRIVVSSMFSVDGIALANTQNQISSLDRQNMILKEQIYKSSAYTTIASSAATMGFIEEKTQITLSGASSIAIKQ